MGKPWERDWSEGSASGPMLTHDGRPARLNSDGSHSTEVSITVANPKLNGGRATNIPSLWDGKELPEDAAVDAALASGRKFDSFGNIDEAVSAARARSAAGGAQAGAVPPWKRDWSGPAKERAPEARTWRDEVSDLGSALWEGAKSTGRSVGAAGNTAAGDLKAVEGYAADQKAAAGEGPEAKRALLEEIERRKKADTDPGVISAVKNVGGAMLDNKRGAAQFVVEQAPNSAVALGSGYAGAKMGAAGGAMVGGPVGAAVGGIGGFLAGMFLGNALLETGGKAIEKADGGFTEAERGEALREGAVKGGVITAVDAATMGIGGKVAKTLNRAAIQAGARAEAQVLANAGVDVASRAAVEKALVDPALRETAKLAGQAAAKQASSLGSKAAIAGTGLTMETAGEGTGEYLGELAATGKADVYDAVTEAAAGFSQSVPTTAWNMRNASGNDLNTRGIQRAGAQPGAAPVPGVPGAIPAADVLDVPDPGAIPAADVLDVPDPVASQSERLAAIKPEAPAPGDILNAKGEPFKARRPAADLQQKTPGSDLVQVQGGWVVRPQSIAEQAEPTQPVQDAAPLAVAEPQPAQAPVAEAAPVSVPPADDLGADVPALKQRWRDAIQSGDTDLARRVNDRIRDIRTGAFTPEAANAPAAEAQAEASDAGGPGSDAGNGFKQGAKPGERYRVAAVDAAGGAVALEKRLPAGTAATFYVGKDGNLVDSDDVNFIGSGREKLWIPANAEQAAQAQGILDEMGRLELTDPARKDAKARLKALVAGSALEPAPATVKESLTTAAEPVADAAPASPSVAPQPKVHKTRRAAEEAKAGNTQRIRKVKGGFILREATDTEMAASEKAGQRLARRGAVDVENDSLLTAIAKLGGIAMAERSDTVGEGNKNVGGKMLFTANGQAADLLASGALRELGYVPQAEVERDGGTRWLRSAIADEFKGARQSFSERGTEWMEEAQRQRDDAMGDPLEDFDVDELDASGYAAASPETQALTEQLVAEAGAMGIDTEAIAEDAARDTEATNDEYHASVQAALRAAIAKAQADAERRDATADRAGDADRSEPAGDQGQEGLTLDAQTETDLRAKTEREAAAVADEAKNKADEQRRLAREAADRETRDRTRQDASADNFALGQDANDALAGQGSIFDAPASLDEAAHEAATSPKNDLPQPTEAQKEAGNYQKGHVSLNGLGLSIENPAGSVRSGVDRGGKAWSITMRSHYGYVKGSQGADKDHIDVFVKPGTPLDYAGPVFVIDQKHPDSGKFDEHKVMIGFRNGAEARAAYDENYARGWKGFAGITRLPFDEFKAWVLDGRKTKALKEENAAKAKVQDKPVQGAPSVAASPARLTDAGEELIRNRRGKLKGLAWDDVSAMNDTLKVAQVVKGNVWPRPDYAKMVEDGAPAWKAAMLKAVYDSLAAAPKTMATPTDADLKAYIQTMGEVREALMAELDRVQAQGDGAADLWKALKAGNVFGKVFPVPADARPIYGAPSAFDRNSEQGKANNKRALLIGGNSAVHALQFGYKALSKAKGLLAEGFPAKQEAWQKSYEVRQTETRDNDVPEGERTGEPQQRFYVYEKGGWRLAKGGQDGGYGSQEAAEAFARSLVAKKKEVLPPSRGLDLADAERTGPDWRGGKNVTAQDIMDRFGFRGVNLGEYVKAKQEVAQLHLNHVFDAFSDLADLLGVPPKAMSLNGTLGVAVGAQGSGKALAHFVPGVNEINITRDSGAGALAHEFGHAVDHYFATQHGRAASTAKRPYLSAAVAGMSDPGGVRPEVIEAMRAVMKTLNSRPMTEAEARKYLADQRDLNQRRLDRWVKEFKGNKGADAAALDAVAEKLKRGDLGEPQDTDLETNLAEFMRAAGLKPGNAIAANAVSVAYRLNKLADEAAFMASHIPQVDTDYAKASKAMDAKKQNDPYWSSPWEMFARAFETFALDALADRQRQNLYLSGLVDSAGWRNWAAETGKSIPYPAGDERLAMQQAFQTLVDTIETREDDGGNVAMYDLSRVAETIGRMGYEKEYLPRIQASRRLATLIRELDEGKIDQPRFESAVRGLAARMDRIVKTKAANRLLTERERGPDLVREKLIRARRHGDLSAEAVDLALWALDQNPAIAENLGMSITAPPEKGTAGQYNPAAEIARLFKGAENVETAVHEILHHAERMMPPELQEPIREAWARALARAIKNATPEQAAALQLIPKAIAGDRAAYKALVKAIQEGPLSYAEHYQLVNPSEFWAVNASRLLSAKHAASDSAWQRVRAWMRGLVEKIKATLGLRSEAPIIRALEYLLDAENFGPERGGRFASPDMLVSQKGSLASDLTNAPDPAHPRRERAFDKTSATVVADFRNDVPLKAQANYRAAKSGDRAAAADMVAALVKPQSIEAARKAFGPGVVYLPVHAEEASGRNQIPNMLASYYAAEAGGTVDAEIVQSNRAFHTGANAMERLVARAEFTGAVEPGKRYVLVDDVTTMGSTLADLAAFIRAGGGEVAGSVVMVNAMRGGTMLANTKVVRELEARHGDEIRKQFGIEPGALTAAEAGYLIGFRTTDELRNRVAAARQARVDRLGSKAVRAEDRFHDLTQPLAASAGQQDDLPGIPPGGSASASSPPRPPRQQRLDLPIEPGWTMPEGSRFDNFVYKAQDKHVDLKRAVGAINKSGQQIEDRFDAYLQEELFHERAAKRTQDFVAQELAPLLDDMKAKGVTQDALDAYLHARHAKEANKLIAERNPEIPDGGSGMTDADADAYMAGLKPEQKADMEALAAKVDAIIAKTRATYVGYGLESKGTVDGWAKMFKHYVPLMREDHDGGMGIGQGFSVRGAETKHRTGSTAKVVDILANIALQREKAIVRGEKNRVAVALAGLVKTNPNPDVWSFGIVPKEQVFNPKTGQVEERVDPLFKSRENALVAKIVGNDGQVHERAVIFNEKNERAVRMAAALKNLDATTLEGVIGLSAKITRYFAAINTQYNPVFGAVNLVRDVQGALINLSSTPLAGNRKAILQHTASALKGIYKDARAGRKGGAAASPWAALWEEFQNEGGATGFRDLYRTSEDRAKAIERALDPRKWMQSPLGQVFTAGGTLKVPMAVAQDKAGWLFDWLSDYNQAMENAVRVSAYKVALEQGMSKQRAASLAKNLTVNFNRKGQAGMQAGALYAFFNAAMQGTARMADVIFDMREGDIRTLRLSKVGKRIVAGGVLLGAMNALMLAAAGFDDEEPPEFVRERNLVIPIGGKKYIAIPMPLGWHVLHNLGRVPTEFMLGGFKEPAKHVIELMGVIADAFNPIGNAGLSMQTLAPTALDPLVALTENRDWTGRPIAMPSFNDAKPGFTRAKDTATTPARWIAEAINWISGGTQYKAGAWSPTPDQIDYLWGQVTGGVGRETAKVEQTVRALWSGEELPPHKVPLVGRFFGNTEGASGQAGQFYTNLKAMDGHEAQIKGLARAAAQAGSVSESEQLYAEREAYTKEHPEAQLWARANVVQRRVRALRERKRELVKADAPRAEVKAVEDDITAVMRDFNVEVRAAREPTPAAAPAPARPTAPRVPIAPPA